MQNLPSGQVCADVGGDDLVVRAGDLDVVEARLLKSADDARMERDGDAVGHPVANLLNGADRMEERVDGVRARDVDDRRRTVGGHEDVAALFGRELERHADVDAHRDDV